MDNQAFCRIRLRYFFCLPSSIQIEEQYTSFWPAGSKYSLQAWHSRRNTISSRSARLRSTSAIHICPLSSARSASDSIKSLRICSAFSCNPFDRNFASMFIHSFFFRNIFVHICRAVISPFVNNTLTRLYLFECSL